MEFERRQHERQKLYSPEYFDMGVDNGGMVVDLSEDGLGFQAVSHVEKGHELTVSFSLGTGYRISARARIAWVGPTGKSGGTTFTRLPADSRSIIREWLTKTAESVAAHEAAAAVEAQISVQATEPEVPLIIERVESPRVPLPARPAAMEMAPEAPVVAEPVFEQVAQPAVEPEAQPINPPVFQPTAEPVADPYVQAFVAPAVEPVAGPDAPFEEEAPSATQQEVLEEPTPLLAADSAAAGVFQESRHENPPETLPEIPSETAPTIPPEIRAEDAENRPKVVETPVEHASTETPRLSFPPRNTGELFSRSPWISGQSFSEEKRSHKGLIAVIICVIVGAAIASVPYVRSHRQQIGEAIVNMGRSVAGETSPVTAGQTQQAAQQSSQQSASQQSAPQQPAPQPSQQLSQAPPQASAPSSNAPSTSGAAIPGSAAITKPSDIPVPSASAAAPVPSGSQTSAPQLHPSTSAVEPGAAAAVSPNLSTAPPVRVSPSTALPVDNGQTEFQRAQQYLNGTGGVAADPAEAAEWFWRSLEKGNTAAAIPLADLYLQGKGVSQSCLQARILLTAASHKGNAQAIQKLIELPENCEQ